MLEAGVDGWINRAYNLYTMWIFIEPEPQSFSNINNIFTPSQTD